MPANDTNYNALWAITDNVNRLAADPIKNNGVFQGAVVDLLNTIRTKFNGFLAKLDADAGVTDTNYVALWALPLLDSKKVGQNGIHQGDLYARMVLIRANLVGATAKMDADGGINYTDYLANSTFEINPSVSGNGMGQKDLVAFLDTFITKFNTTLSNLDLDGV